MNYIEKIKLLLRRMNNLSSDKLTLKQQLSFFKMLSELLNNGFSLKEALLFLKTINISNITIIELILNDLNKGVMFSKCLKSYINNNLYYQLMIAEEHGHLIQCLMEIHSFLKAKYNQEQKLKEIAAYPTLLLFLLVSVIIGIKHFITPQLKNFGAVQSNNLGMFMLIIIIILLLFIIGYVLWLYKLPYLKRIDQMMKIPMINLILKNYYAYYIANNLSFMLQSGMNIKSILNLIINFKNNSLMYQLGIELKEDLEKGHDFELIIKRHKFIPKQLFILLISGDELNQLAMKIDSYSKICFQNTFKYSSRLINILQPLMFLIIGITIMLTYMDMLMPMYNALKGVYV